MAYVVVGRQPNRLQRQRRAAKLRRVLDYLLRVGADVPPVDWDAVYTVDRALWEVKYFREVRDEWPFVPKL